LENMALQDLEHGHGIALIDPRGDLVARIAARVPTSRRSDIVYLCPPSALMRQIGWVEEGRISGSS